MEENKIVNKVVSELSKINSAASGYADSLEQAKKDVELEYRREKEAYDAEIAEASEERLARLKEELWKENSEKLDALSREYEAYIKELKESFEKNHTKWAEEIAERAAARRL